MADNKRNAPGKNDVRPQPDEQQQASSPEPGAQQGSTPANNEERHGQQLDKGRNADDPSAGDTGAFGSQAPFGGGPRK